MGEKWVRVRELDGKFLRENRKVALIIENCPKHPTIGNLSNFWLIFLPPNTTPVSQPMDQGVIKMLKGSLPQKLG